MSFAMPSTKLYLKLDELDTQKEMLSYLRPAKQHYMLPSSIPTIGRDSITIPTPDNSGL
ncbi:MAG: hypothetical protein K9J37_04450 [Saprospiraceae bacterium]|nr:hypothetical protein [Saprospiraceae bacterium]MCF8249136.1 hypothetical protein [Saprospiraceae bacterium]MCF8281393.1 hypothetical protein [Bacteroidales bacterium]MCF8311158.1 hypothetical protein [Saprospiraceae bacterium]MCF8440248.1 hypothetical protein [Saprospiraceae bacterium]